MDDILMHLPEKSMWEKELLRFANAPEVNRDLGHIMSYSCELRDEIDPEDSWILEAKQQKKWMARCTCSNCGEELITAKVRGKDAVLFYEGEDSQLYEVIGDPAGYAEGGQFIETADWDHVTCPYCGVDTTLIHSKKLRGDRTKQIMVETLETVNGKTAIMYWLINRRFCEYGGETDSVLPFMAEVILENGRMKAYSHRKSGFYGSMCADIRWKPYNGRFWPDEVAYSDWGSINSKKKGSFNFREKLPEMLGTTGEKTGIHQYIKAGGNYSGEYMKLWRAFHGVENLLNFGLFNIVEDILKEAYRYSADVLVEAKKYLNIGASKPHEILGISKADLRQWMKQSGGPTITDLQNLRWYYSLGGTLNAPAAAYQLKQYGGGLSALKEMHKRGEGIDLQKIEGYLLKQGLRKNDVRYLADARRFAAQLNPYTPLTHEQLWPRRLLETHDRLSRAVALILNDKDQGNFIRVADRLGDLEWTDGELRIVVPRSNEDLIREGETLRHCVGTYGPNHLAGKDTIFFVRRYKKPNTPYYTLDIDLTGRPRRVQLHGYGNEHHGQHKEKRHTIPKSVLAFCDKWEREVLHPWYLQKQNKKESIAV